jgi:hypothetical protein
MKRRSSSALRTIPSTANLSVQTEKIFQTAGTDVKPVRVRSADEARQEIEFLESQITKNVEWDDQVTAIQRGMALVNGGALEFEVFTRGLNRVAGGLVDAAKNLRSALVKQSCLFIAQLARELTGSIDLLGDLITPLSSQLSHGTQIIAESCKFAILSIAQYCCSRRVMKAILDIANSKVGAVRVTASEALQLSLLHWTPDIPNSNAGRIETALSKLLSDPAIEAREAGRKAARAYQTALPNRANEFISHLDARTQRAIRELVETARPARVEYNTREENEIPNTARPSCERRRPSPKPRADPAAKPPEKVDIAANPPRILKKKPEPEPKPSLSARTEAVAAMPPPTRIEMQDIPRMMPARRQSSVQPVRPLSGLQSSIERRKPIRLESGQEKEYLESLRQNIDEERTSELASSMPFIARDLFALMSNRSAVISSLALQAMNDLLPIYAPHFRAILPSLVEGLISQIETANPRSAATASLILSNLHKSIDGNSLLLIALTLVPSVPLLNLTDILVSLSSKEIDIANDTVCQKLISIAFRCQSLTPVKNKHTAARIVERVHSVNPTAVSKFAASLKGQQISQFAEFIRPSIPDVKIKPGGPDVPAFSAKNGQAWKRSIQTIIETTRNEKDWNLIRPKLFTQLNQSLRDKSDANGIDLVPAIFARHGCDGFGELLQGILLNARGPASRTVDAIMTSIANECELRDITVAVQPLIGDPDIEIVRAALGLQTKLISGAELSEMKAIVTNLIPALSSAFESELPEIRKAVVLCFVELYAKLGKNIMDRHTSHLSKGQLKLISIYLSRRKD